MTIQCVVYCLLRFWRVCSDIKIFFICLFYRFEETDFYFYFSAKELTSGEGVSEVCPWEGTDKSSVDNICPWESASAPTPQPKKEQALASSRQQQSLQQSSLPPSKSILQHQQQLVKPRPDRSKSVDVNTIGSQRPQSTPFVPTLGPIRGTSPSESSPARSEKARSVDVCPWENTQPPVKKAPAAPITSPKESTVSTLAPTTSHQGERRASEGVLRMALGVCPWEDVLTPSQKGTKSAKEEGGGGGSEGIRERASSTSVKIKVSTSKEEGSKCSKSESVTKLSLEATKSEPPRSPTSPKSKTEMTKKKTTCTAVVPYEDPRKKMPEPLKSVPGPSETSRGPSSGGSLEPKSSGVGEPVSPGKSPNVVAPWEDSPPQKASDVCPWEDE